MGFRHRTQHLCYSVVEIVQSTDKRTVTDVGSGISLFFRFSLRRRCYGQRSPCSSFWSVARLAGGVRMVHVGLAVVSCPAHARLLARNSLVNEVEFLGLITQNG